MSLRVVSFSVQGKPEPKGSMKAFVPKRRVTLAAATGTSPRAVLTSDNPKAAAWQRCIATAARLQREPRFTEAVAVALLFRLPRPKRLPKHTDVEPAVKPDIDKLVRLALDALTDAALWRDDAQVVELHARKIYTVGDEAPGVRITIADFGEPEP